MKNFISRSLTHKLIVVFLIIVIVPLAIVGYLSYASGKTTIQKQFLNNLTAIAESRESAIIYYLRGKGARVVDFSSDGFIRDSVKQILAGEGKAAVDALNTHLVRNKMFLDTTIYGINVLNMEGKVIASTMYEELGLDESQSESLFLKTRGLDYGKAHVSDVSLSRHFGKHVPSFSASAILTDKDTGEKLGMIVNYSDTRGLNAITTNREGLRQSGEVYIVNKNGVMITESRFIKAAVLKQRVDTDPVKLFRSKKKLMTDIYPDYRGVLILGASMGDEIEREFGFGWTVLAEIDIAEAFAPVRNLRWKIIRISLFIGVLAVLVAYFIGRRITKPLGELVWSMQKVSEGDLTVKAKVTTEDEIGDLALSFNKMAENLGLSIQKEKELAATAAAAEVEKKKSEELRAANQQLRASEQQQKAANQQLRASEQQLRASNQQLEAKEQALRSSQEELRIQMSNLERFNRLMIGREMQMVNLKEEINSLLEKSGESQKYQAPASVKEALGAG